MQMDYGRNELQTVSLTFRIQVEDDGRGRVTQKVSGFRLGIELLLPCPTRNLGHEVISLPGNLNEVVRSRQVVVSRRTKADNCVLCRMAIWTRVGLCGA